MKLKTRHFKSGVKDIEIVLISQLVICPTFTDFRTSKRK